MDSLGQRALERESPSPTDERRVAAAASGGAEPELGDAIRCLACEHALARHRDRIAVGESHAHTFMNPAGFVFRIELFGDAAGVVAPGPASAEWSWFPGTEWRIALCRGCAVHVGWTFSDDTRSFVGLVSDRIVER